MRRILIDWGSALAIAVVVYLLVGALRGHGGGSAPPATGSAPAFSIEDLDGAEVSLASLSGKTTVLNFWASWCGPCKAEIPEFVAFSRAHPDIPVIGIAVDSGSVSEVRQASQRFGITYPVAMADRAIVRAYKVDALPTTVVLSPTGDVLFAQVGGMSAAELEAAVGGD